jgi:hypothetical protein
MRDFPGTDIADKVRSYRCTSRCRSTLLARRPLIQLHLVSVGAHRVRDHCLVNAIADAVRSCKKY